MKHAQVGVQQAAVSVRSTRDRDVLAGAMGAMVARTSAAGSRARSGAGATEEAPVLTASGRSHQ